MYRQPTPTPIGFHTLKTWPEPFRAIVEGRKTYEVRKNDRGFCEGDLLNLREYEPACDHFSGRFALARITYITRGGEWGLPEDMCVLALGAVQYGKERP